MATLVCGASATRVTGSADAMISSRSISTADLADGSRLDSGRATPPSPSTPWNAPSGRARSMSG